MTESFNTVLLVDDDELSLYITEKLIRDHQYGQEIFTFMSVQGAFAFLEKAAENEGLIQATVAIFLDITMGELDGWDFLNAYRILPKSLKDKCKLYILSSSIDEKNINRVSTYPEICRYISKPLTKEMMEIIKPLKEEVL